MGLAPYGSPKYVGLIKEKLIKIYDDGSFQLNMSYFEYCTGLKMTNSKFNDLFGIPARKQESKLEQIHMDIAASVQKVTEEVVLKLANSIFKETRQDNLCLAGGVALNCVANGIILKQKIFKNIWIQPASGDAGCSLGAALCVYYLKYKKERKINNNLDNMKGSYLGPKYNNKEIIDTFSRHNVIYRELNEIELLKEVSIHLKNSLAIGWMQGRMEFGPRSLGNRSILADPRSPHTQKQLN